jgi:iron complex outermembrane receptor protein
LPSPARLAFLALLIICAPASAQDSSRVTLPVIRVEATRGSFSPESSPVSISVLRRTAEIRASEPALALENVLTQMPGLWLADRGHFALGERLVVRGLGSRAGFGVRSVAVLLDGVLLTMPDGQAVLDPIEPAAIARAELIRGPASRFWGNAAGGVLVIESGELPHENGSSARFLGGSEGSLQLIAKGQVVSGRQRTLGYGSILDRTGHRDYSAGKMLRAGIRSTRALASGGILSASLNASQLDTESPGSLTLAQWEDDPAAADSRYTSTRSGKIASQVQGSVAYTGSLWDGLASASLFGVQRSLDNPLPFAWVGVQRLAGGGRADWHRDLGQASVGVGIDYRIQTDDRINTENADGGRGATISLDQTETIGDFGVSVITEVRATRAIAVSAGVRADRLTVDMKDHLLSNGDASGRESFGALSPSVGVSYSRGINQFFASWATSFEIPTTTELVNRPDGLGGFNPDLDPQRVTGIEAGIRSSGSLGRAELVAYRQHLTNFLSPYQLEEFAGRTFYRNVGEVDYIGLEVSLETPVNEHVGLGVAASVHQYEFATGELDGSRIPGIPMAFGSALLTYQDALISGSIRARVAGSQFADDANTAEVDGFVTLDLRLAARPRQVGRSSLLPFLEVSNLLDAGYVASIVPNARGSRFYEGAPGRAIRGGVSVVF